MLYGHYISWGFTRNVDTVVTNSLEIVFQEIIWIHNNQIALVITISCTLDGKKCLLNRSSANAVPCLLSTNDFAQFLFLQFFVDYMYKRKYLFSQ